MAQLDAIDKSARDSAEQALIQLGEPVLDQLPAVDAPLSAEARTRITRVRRQIEQQLVKRTTLATHVTWRAHEQLLSDALAEINRQTRNRVVDYRKTFGQDPREIRVSLEAQNLAFWPTIDRLLDAAGLDVYLYGDAGSLALVAKANDIEPDRTWVCYRDAFRVEATDIVAWRNLHNRNPSARGIHLKLETCWEPRLQIARLTLPGSGFELRFGDGPVQRLEKTTVIEANVPSQAKGAELVVPLPAAPGDGMRTLDVSGELRALVLGRQTEFRFPQLVGAPRTEQRHGDAIVVLESVERPPVAPRDGAKSAELKIAMTVVFDDPSLALESHRSWAASNLAWLETPDRRRIEPTAKAPTRQTDRELGMEYRFPLQTNDWSGYAFVYQTPTAIVDVAIPFELKRVELP